VRVYRMPTQRNVMVGPSADMRGEL
jgi:hypothetical protein